MGELGAQVDLSSIPNLQNIILENFGRDNEETKAAAAYALGEPSSTSHVPLTAQAQLLTRVLAAGRPCGGGQHEQLPAPHPAVPGQPRAATVPAAALAQGGHPHALLRVHRTHRPGTRPPDPALTRARGRLADPSCRSLSCRCCPTCSATPRAPRRACATWCPSAWARSPTSTRPRSSARSRTWETRVRPPLTQSSP